MADVDQNQITIKGYIPILESIMRISLAGFGGAMAGLSISRRAALSRTATSIVTQSTHKKREHVIHRHHPLATRPGDGTPYATDRELPAAWAMACMAFTGVIEFTRYVSPAGFAVDFLSRFSDEGVKDEELSAIDGNLNVSSVDISQSAVPIASIFSGLSLWLSAPTTELSLKTIADYTIGGAVGGALFAGSAVRTPAGKRIDASILGSAVRSTGPLQGLLPGAGLGLLAGVIVVSMDSVRELLEEKFGEIEDQLDESIILEQSNKETIENDADTVPAHIKAMTNEELAKAIDELRR